MGETYGKIQQLRYMFDAVTLFNGDPQLVQSGANAKSAPGELLSLRRHPASGEIYLLAAVGTAALDSIRLP
jgi:hypothetical protein